MCYSIEQVQAKIKNMINRGYITQKDIDNMPNNYLLQGFTFPMVKAVTNEKPFHVSDLQWGLIPFWAKQEQANEIVKYNLNSVSETMDSKPSFKHLVGKKHCLIPVNGFFEWMHVGKVKYPHFITLKNQEPFMLAGLWDSWADKETGEIKNTFTICTTQANPLMAKIHNTKKRMPVIILEENETAWLEATNKNDIKELTRPIDANLMDAHTVSRLITSRTQNANVPEVTEKFVYPELESNKLF
ncbi:SOS response-associated peptidase [Draconibacterium sp.]|jgi:putative SOS response-associated peptidase YedK